jgi:hypothetical protein
MRSDHRPYISAQASGSALSWTSLLIASPHACHDWISTTCNALKNPLPLRLFVPARYLSTPLSPPPPSSRIVFPCYFVMSASGRGRKCDKFLNVLAAPFRASRTPSPQPTPPTIAPVVPQTSGISAITASGYLPAPPVTASAPPPPPAQATESWWSAHRTEIVAGVRQVLGLAKEALEGLPVYGPAAVVSTAERFLESVQVRQHPYWRS